MRDNRETPSRKSFSHDTGKRESLKRAYPSDCQNSLWRDITRTVERLGKYWSHRASSSHTIRQSTHRNFFIQQATGTSAGRVRKLKSWIGELHLTAQQAKRLGVKSYTKISPYLEKCCLIVSANVSYQNAALDIKVLTGIEVSAKTQHRLVHRQKFELPKIQERNSRVKCRWRKNPFKNA